MYLVWRCVFTGLVTFGVGCSWVQSAIAEDEVVARMAMIGLKKYSFATDVLWSI